MKFISKTEAYTYILAQLILLKQSVVHHETLSNLISRCIHRTEIALGNHEQQPLVLIDSLKMLYPHLDHKQLKPIQEMIEALENSTYEQTAQERFENPLARRLESEFATILLLAPTRAMMAAVGEISNQLLGFIHEYMDLEDYFSSQFREDAMPTSLGAFKEPPKFKEIQKY